MSPAVAAEDVRVRLGATEALRGADLVVASGSVTALLGPSGCGKTTLLRVLAGFHPADSGRVALGGRVVQDARTFVPAARRAIGYVAQEGALFPHLSVADNIAFGLDRAGWHRRRRTHARQVADLLDLVELPQLMAARLPRELSGGQQQRVALARALAPGPDVVLLDEPFSSLDAHLRQATGRATVQAVRRSGAAAVIVTHDQAEALSLADRIAVMRDGVIAQAGAPEDVYTAPADLDTARQLGNGVVLHAQARGSRGDCALGPVVLSGSFDGPVEVVVRPEQIRITGDGVPATVLAAHYFGHHCLLDLALADGVQLSARVGLDHRPAVAEVVRVGVHGPVTAYRVGPPGQA